MAYDAFGERRLMLAVLEDADHSFHVPARSGRRDPEVLAQALGTLAAWIEANR